MSKTLFSFHLDDDLKLQATTRATAERRTLANLIETAVDQYVNPKPIGARVTVKTVDMKLPKGSPLGEFTARVSLVDTEKKTVILDTVDPITGKNEFPLKNILSVHLL